MKKSRIGLILIPIAIVAAVVVWRFVFSSGPEAATVSLGKVETVDILRTVSVSGTLKPTDVELLPVSTSRRVKTVKAKEGDLVRKGQVLAELDVADLELQRQKLLLAGAQIESDLKELTAPTLTASSTAVKARVSQLELDLTNARRKLAEAETRLEQDQTLFDAGSISASVLDASKSARNDLADQVKRTETSLTSARTEVGDLPDATAQKTGTLIRQQAQNKIDLELLDRQLAESHLTASIDGLLVSFPLKEGRYPENGDVLRIEDTSTWKLVVRLTQQEALQVMPGQDAAFTLKGLNDTFTAKVEDLSKEAAVENGSGSRTPKVEATLVVSAPDSRMASGFDADVVIETGRLSQVAGVKREALGTDQTGNPFLFVLNDVASGTDGSIQGTLRQITVVPGIEDNSYVAVGEVPPVGSVIVLAPSADLTDGLLVKGSVAP